MASVIIKNTTVEIVIKHRLLTPNYPSKLRDFSFSITEASCNIIPVPNLMRANNRNHDFLFILLDSRALSSDQRTLTLPYI